MEYYLKYVNIKILIFKEIFVHTCILGLILRFNKFGIHMCARMCRFKVYFFTLYLNGKKKHTYI